MEHVQIPTHLLDQAGNVLPNLGYQFEQAEFEGDVQVSQKQMFMLLPLIKWLEYFQVTTWNTESN